MRGNYETDSAEMSKSVNSAGLVRHKHKTGGAVVLYKCDISEALMLHSKGFDD